MLHSSKKNIISQKVNTAIIQCAIMDADGIIFLDADDTSKVYPKLDGVYRGKVLKKSKQVYWVDFGLGEGILPFEKGLPLLSEGQSVCVQIARESLRDRAQVSQKLPVLTRKISYAGPSCVFFYQGNFISRTMPISVEQENEKQNLYQLHLDVNKAFLSATTPGVLWEGLSVWERFLRDLSDSNPIYVDNDKLLSHVQDYCTKWRPDLVSCLKRTRDHLFPDDFYEELFLDHVDLRDGSVFFEETAIGTVIDVNTSMDVRSFKDINMDAARIIAQHIICRGISGKILIDFIDSAQKHRKEVEDQLAIMLKASNTAYQILGWSRSGLLEIVSDKRRMSLSQRMKGENYEFR